MFGRAWPQPKLPSRALRRVIGVRQFVPACCGVFVLLLVGCKKSNDADVTTAATTPIPSAERIPPELATKVLAKVGERVITVADYASTLDRMDRFERLRYQTPERRKGLLDELVNTELLAREAERRGLDKRPETQAYVNQLLADEVRRRLRAALPQPEALSNDEVQAYYAAHREELRQPERRRVAMLTFPSKASGDKVLTDLKADGSVARWNELGRQHATEVQANNVVTATVIGDLGFVTASGDVASGDAALPDAVRAAAFKVGEKGGVAPELIEGKGAFYLVRVTTVAQAHLPSVEEADASLRARIIDAQLAEKERELSKLLETGTPVEVNEAVMSRLKRATP
jgi:peptidyl-prolyl cis-trans isomerase C